MRYQKVIPGEFIVRRNRFIAEVNINCQTETVHVKNTGRCRELLVPGTEVYLSETENPNRKTKYDLIAVRKQRQGKTPLLINMDSQIPNDAVREWLPHSGLFSKAAVFKREKSVTAEQDKLFPFSHVNAVVHSYCTSPQLCKQGLFSSANAVKLNNKVVRIDNNDIFFIV